MPDVSSAEAASGGARLSTHRTAARLAGELPLSPVERLVMIACGFIPLLHLLATLMPLALTLGGRADRRTLALMPAALYVMPPLIVRVCTWIRPLPSGAVPVGSDAFLLWWFTAQWQVLFARLPFLEELLRVVPALYSLWLRLWGSQIGRLVYWSPGVAVTDRSLVRIGDRVVFGLGVRLSAHVIAPSAEGRNTLYLAPVAIGRDSLVGGYSLLLAGCEIAPGQATPPFRTLHPFTRWSNGRRVAVEHSPLVSSPEDGR